MEEDNRKVVITFCDLLEGRKTDISRLIYALLSSYILIHLPIGVQELYLFPFISFNFCILNKVRQWYKEPTIINEFHVKIGTLEGTEQLLLGVLRICHNCRHNLTIPTCIHRVDAKVCLFMQSIPDFICVLLYVLHLAQVLQLLHSPVQLKQLLRDVLRLALQPLLKSKEKRQSQQCCA